MDQHWCLWATAKPLSVRRIQEKNKNNRATEENNWAAFHVRIGKAKTKEQKIVSSFRVHYHQKHLREQQSGPGNCSVISVNTDVP